MISYVIIKGSETLVGISFFSFVNCPGMSLKYVLICQSFTIAARAQNAILQLVFIHYVQ